MATAQSFNLRVQNEYMNPANRMVCNLEECLCDWKFRIYQNEDCNGEIVGALEMYYDAYFNPLDYEKDEDEEENGFGEIESSRVILRRVANFNVIVDQQQQEYLYRQSVMNNLRLYDRDSEEIFTILKMAIDKVGVLDGYLIELQIRLYFSHEDFEKLGMISCCRPAFTDAPFNDDCPELPGGTDDCGDFDVTVTIDGDDLTATPTDAPGAVTINWLYREDASQPWTTLVLNASTISLGAFGQYKAVALSEGCSVDDSYLYQDPCGSMSVTIEDNGAGLTAVGIGCLTPIYTWFVWDEDNSEWDQVFIGASFVPAEAGIYKVVLSGCGDCTTEAIHEWSGDSDCELTVSLNYVGNQLNALTSPCESGGQSYEWYRDNGAGPVLVQSGLLATYLVTDSGLYEVYVTCIDSDCTGYARKVITCTDSCMLTLDIAIDADTATATVDGCEGDIEFTWFRNSGSGYQEVGTGNPFELEEVGLYRLDVLCEDGCDISQEFFHCPGSTQCNKSQYFTNFVGTNLVITAFNLPNPEDFTEKYIRDNLWVFRNTQKVSFNLGYTIDFENNTIILTWEAESEFIEVYWRADCL